MCWFNVTRALPIAFLFVLAWRPYAFALNPALDISQYAHTSWKIRDGHFKGTITSIAQPPDGYLWLGTELGMLRFDGVRFVPWQPPPGESLLSNNIHSMLVARDGTLWIGTDRGLASWKDGRLTHYDALAGSYIGYKLVEDPEGTIWLMRFVDRLWTLCGVQKTRVTCHGDDGGPGAGTLGLYVDRRGTLWAGTSSGIWRWQPGPPRFHPMAPQNNGIQGLAEDGDGVLLVATAGGINRLVDDRMETGHVFPSSIAQFQAQRLLRDRDGGLWGGATTYGLVHVREGRTDVFSRFDGLSGDSIIAIFEDREANIWVSTTDGLDRFRESAVVPYSVSQGLSSSRVSSVLASSEGSVWVSTYDGLNRFKDGQLTVHRVRSASRAAGPWPFVSRQVSEITTAGIPGPVQAIFEDSRRRVWLSTSSEVGQLQNGKFAVLPGIPGGLTRAIVEDIHGNLWFANLMASLYRMAPDGQMKQIAWSALKRPDPASAFVADPSGKGLWVGFFRGGIVHFDGDRLGAAYGAAEGLAEGRVSSLYADAEQALWVAAEGGLSRLKNGSLITLTSKNGLPCDAVGWIIEDAARSLWLGMPCGLARIARADLDAWMAAAGRGTPIDNRTRRVNVTTLDQLDGVRNFVDASYFTAPVVRTSDGKLWFMSQDGVGVVDPARLPVNALKAPVHIEQVIADRQTYRVRAFPGERIRLPPLTRDLQIDFTAVSLVAPEKVRFRYKLEGHDSDWQDVGARRQAFYSALPPGPYRFRVTAANNSGVWNDAGQVLELSIAPAYYQSAWFRVAALVTIVAFVCGVYRLRLRQLAQAFNLRLNERVNERTRIARELHDTLLQSFQGLILRFQSARDLLPADPEKAAEALDGALDRADQALVEGRDAIQNLRSVLVGSNELAQAITTLAEEFTHGPDGARSSATFFMSVEGSPRDLHPLVRDDIHRIAREALRNAFRHAHAAHIEAEITYGAREVRLRIRDDGKGIDPKLLSNGSARHWGLTGMRERAAHIGAQLDLWSELGAGTEVELRVPGAVAYGQSGARGSAARPNPEPRGGS